MEESEFRPGESLWLRGKPVIFVEYHFLSKGGVGGAVVRSPDEPPRVVPISRLARDKGESFAREWALAAAYAGARH